MAKVGFNNGVLTATQVTVDPQAAADAVVQYNESTVAKWRHGNDETNDSWRLSQGSALGTNDTLIADTSGQLSFPRQLAFDYYNNSSNANATGDGTTFTLIYPQIANGGAQQGSGWDGTSTFTATSTGYYQFNMAVRITGLAAQTSAYTTFTHTAIQTYYGPTLNPTSVFVTAFSSGMTLAQSVMMRMVAGDTVTTEITVAGSTKTVTVDGTQADTYINGAKIC